MSCKIKIKKHNETLVVKLSGDVAAHDITSLSQKLESHYHKPFKNLVIDLEEAKYIDSNGLGFLVYTWKTLQAENKELVFLNPQDFIRKLFEGTHLHQMFRIIKNLEEL